MDQIKFASERKFLGRLLAAFGGFTLAASIAGAFLADAMIVDAGAFIVFWLAGSVARGSVRGLKWSGIVIGWYAVVAIGLTATWMIAPQRILIGGRPPRAEFLPYMVIFCGIAGTWAIVNLAMLWKHASACAKAVEKRD